MKRDNKRVFVSLAVATCMLFTTEFGTLAADTQSNAQPIETVKHETVISPLAETWNAIPQNAEVAEATQVWYGKALANVEAEADVYTEAADGSAVVGKMYDNTILTVEERGDEWSKVTSGAVTGYVKNEVLAFGSAAVERAASINMENPKEAKTLEQIEEERKAAEEAARKKAAEEAAKKSNMTARYDAATAASVDDLTLMAAIIYCEAGNQPYDGKVGVGAVILNRIRSSRYPNTLREVIYQRGQFGPAITGKLDRVLAKGNIPQNCYDAASAAFGGYNPIGDCLYFGCGNYGMLIGDHYFH